MNRNGKKSDASASSRRTIAAVTSVRFVATGLIDVISTPSLGARERVRREGLYGNDLLRTGE
jgi:hypothetical protein